MQVKKMNESIDLLKDELGKSLLMVDIWSAKDGMTLASYGAEASSAALGNKLISDISKTLQGVHVPPLGRYFLIDLQGDSKIILLPMHDFACIVMVDKDVQLGLFLNVVMPEFLDKFEEAVVG